VRFLFLFLALSSLGYTASDLTAKVKAQAKGWDVLESAEGDLNGDGIADIAAILFQGDVEAAAQAENPPPAPLRVYFADKSGNVKLAVEAPKATCVHCGGMKGGPVPFSLQIAKGVFQLTYSGGSRYAYAVTTKWRYQKDGFYLIGITATDVDTAGSDVGAIVGIERDVNLSTLAMVEKIEKIRSATPDGERKTTGTEKRCKVPASFQRKRLEEYDVEESEVPKCTSVSL
jgi:hypothetical protein